MTEETRLNLALVNLTDPPVRPYMSPIPRDGLIFDYEVVKEGTGRWVKWSDSLRDIPSIPRDVQYNEIIVPTVATVRYVQLMNLLVTHQKACLFVGPTGTGKSLYIIVCTACHLSLIAILLILSAIGSCVCFMFIVLLMNINDCQQFASFTP